MAVLSTCRLRLAGVVGSVSLDPADHNSIVYADDESRRRPVGTELCHPSHYIRPPTYVLETLFCWHALLADNVLLHSDPPPCTVWRLACGLDLHGCLHAHAGQRFQIFNHSLPCAVDVGSADRLDRD